MSKTLSQVEEDSPPPLINRSDLGDPADFFDLDDDDVVDHLIDGMIDAEMIWRDQELGEFCPTMVMSSVRSCEFASDLKVTQTMGPFWLVLRCIETKCSRCQMIKFHVFLCNNVGTFLSSNVAFRRQRC